jgi:hypothetical protein
MPKSVHIATPNPTLEERAKDLRIPKARQKELRELVNEFMATRFSRDQAPVRTMEPEKRRKSASAA